VCVEVPSPPYPRSRLLIYCVHCNLLLPPWAWLCAAGERAAVAAPHRFCSSPPASSPPALFSRAHRDPCHVPFPCYASSRGSLDEVCSALRTTLNASNTGLWCLHADLGPREAQAAVSGFLDAATRSKPAVGAGASGQKGERLEKDQPLPTLAVLTATDPPLLALVAGASSPSQQTSCGMLLVHYDLPATRESYQNRLATVAGAEGQQMAIHFLVAPTHLDDLRNLVEGFAERAFIEEMPVHVADIFYG
jgi:hypothetical protein